MKTETKKEPAHTPHKFRLGNFGAATAPLCSVCGLSEQGQPHAVANDAEHDALYRLLPVTNELLAACKRGRDHLIMDIGRDGKGIYSHDSPQALEQIRAAIASAEGRAQ